MCPFFFVLLVFNRGLTFRELYTSWSKTRYAAPPPLFFVCTQGLQSSLFCSLTFAVPRLFFIFLFRATSTAASLAARRSTARSSPRSSTTTSNCSANSIGSSSWLSGFLGPKTGALGWGRASLSSKCAFFYGRLLWAFAHAVIWGHVARELIDGPFGTFLSSKSKPGTSILGEKRVFSVTNRFCTNKGHLSNSNHLRQ